MEHETKDVPCLICGEVGPFPFQEGVIVKEEVDSDIEEKQVEADNGVCATKTTWSSEDKLVYDCLLKYFKVRSRWKPKHKIEQWGSALPFCDDCKMELLDLAELQIQMEEITEKIRKFVASLKDKLENCEGKFKENQVYERDKRYQSMRSMMVTTWFKENVIHSTKKSSSRLGQKIPSEKVNILKGNWPTGLKTKQLLEACAVDQLLPDVKPACSNDEAASNTSPIQFSNDLEDLLEKSRPKRKRQTTKVYGQLVDDSAIDELFIGDLEHVSKPEESSPKQHKNQKRKVDEDWTEDQHDSGSESERHSKRKPYPKVPCPICGKFMYINHRKVHMWTHKNAEERQIALSTGDPSVPSYIIMKLNTSQKPKEYQCHVCGLDFKSSFSVQAHYDRLHAPKEVINEMKELCPECGGTFFHLQQHLARIHGQGAHRCLEPKEDGTPCDKTFSRLSDLTKHKDIVHRRLMPWKCDLCPRSFNQKKALNAHKQTHLGVRPWKCDQCDLAFTKKYHMQRHQTSFHAEAKASHRRKPFLRGPTMLKEGKSKSELIKEGKYLPPSALASWAAGREPTSHFPKDYVPNTETQEGK